MAFLLFGGGGMSRLFFKFSLILAVSLLVALPTPALAATELITNGGFEAGNFNGWVTGFTPGGANVWCTDWVVTTETACAFEQVTPPEGSFFALNGFDGTPMQFTMYQDVTIPASSTALFSFMYRAQWYNYNDVWTQARAMDVQVRNTSNTVLKTIHHFSTGQAICCFIHEDSHWITVSADLSAYAGQTIRLAIFENVPEGVSGGAQMYFDNFTLQAYTGSVGKINVQQSGGTTTIQEGGTTDSFRFTLSQAPTAPVTVNLTKGSPCNISLPSVALNSGNWDSGVTVTATAVNDGAIEISHLCLVTTAAASSADAAFNTVDAPDVPVTVLDNDGTAPQITSCPPPTATMNAPYRYGFTKTGNPTPTFVLNTSVLPDGLSLSSGGVISGTPSAQTAGNLVTASAENAAGPYDNLSFVLTVRPATSNPPTLYNPSPSGDVYSNRVPFPGMVGKFYCFRFQSYGNPTPTYTLTGASLPAGLSRVGDTIVGTPTAAGTTGNITVTAENSQGTDSKTFTLTIYPAKAVPSITSSAPPIAYVGLPYSHTFTATGGPTPEFGLNGAALPPGLTFDHNVISGTPTTVGGYGLISALARNGIGRSGAQDFTLTVVDIHPHFTSSLPANGTVGAAYTHIFTAIGQPAPTFSISGTLPAGLTWDGTDTISGTPLAGGTSATITATASNGNLPNDTQNFTLTITSPANAVPSGNYALTATPTLTWGRISNATEYELELYDNSALSGTPTYVYSDSANQTTVTPALPDGVYYWRARAITPSGTGAWSAKQTITVNG
jgi:hypothetical protein